MKSNPFPFLAFFVVLASPFYMATTCSQQELAPGPYQGDTLLARFDEMLINVNDTFETVIGVADRNPAAVAANPELAEKVAKLRAEFNGVPEPGEVIPALIQARNAYVVAKTAVNGQALEGQLSTARTALETARALIPLFFDQPEPDAP